MSCLSVNAQDFTLFEGFESTDSDPSSVETDAREARVTESAPVFTLAGTSRIGDLRMVHLLHSSGETVSVRVSDPAATAIPGYQGYELTGFAAGNVQLTLPSNRPCQEFLDKGVRCESGGNTANLELRTGEVQVAQNTAAEEEAPQEEVPDNPFARIRAANADNPADSNSQRFRPRRIDPADVPEGMRVISTPFGDRLVQE